MVLDVSTAPGLLHLVRTLSMPKTPHTATDKAFDQDPTEPHLN